MIKPIKWLIVAISFLAGSQSYAVSLSLDGSRVVESGTDCEVATYRFGVNETWNGTPLDLIVEVVEEDNEFAQNFCVGVLDGVFAVHLRDKDAGDDVAFVDTVMTFVQAGTNTPVFVDRITATGFDLDNNGVATGPSSTLTDDLYMTAIGAGFVSGNTAVTYGTGSYTGGHDVYLQGQDIGNCADSPNTPVVSCRASATWTGGAANQVSSISVRFQNDNAYGQYDVNNNGAYRLLQLSFDDAHAEVLLGAISDYGDTPSSYGNAHHPSVSVYTLLGYGLAPDHEPAQQAGAAANGDDTDQTPGSPNYDDEDGIFRNGTSLEGQTLTAGVNEVIDVVTFGSGYLSGWVDLNHDGDFLDADEHVLADVHITGTTTQTTSVSMNIPLTAVGGTAYARFRFDTQQNLTHNSNGVRGEVEDYQVQIDPMAPSYNMVKSADLPVMTAAGQIAYTFTFYNTGNVPLSNVTVTDPNIDSGSLTGCPTTVPVGGSSTCTAVRTVSQLQIDNGNTLTNTATPYAEDPVGGIAAEDSTTDNSAQTTISATYSHAINKPAPANADEDGSGDVSVGDTLTYTVTATNTGSGTLTNLLVEDPMLAPSNQNCAAVAPGGTCVLVGTYVVDADDVIALAINNTATAISDQTALLSDSETVPVLTPALTIAKPAPGNADEDASTDISIGDTLTYTVTATNSGAATLTNVVVNDPMLTPSSNTCGSLAPSATCVLTGTHTVTSADVALTTITNTADATSDQAGPVDAEQTVSLPTPTLALDKPAPTNGDQDGSGDVSVGDVLTYTITATNTGTAILTDVIVADLLITPTSTTCALVAPGATCVLTGTYSVTAPDVTATQIDNTATANSDQTAEVEALQSVVLNAPALQLDKSSPVNSDEDGSTDISVGDTLTYTVTATNSGTATLTNVVVTDPMLSPGTANCATLASTETCVLTGSYTVVASDIATDIVNTANATSNQTAQIFDTETVPVPDPALVLSKPAPVNADEDSSTDISAGDTLTYTITATNSGTATLTNVVVSDVLITPNSNTCAVLAPGASCELVGTYSVSGDDVIATMINNTANAVSDQTAVIEASQLVNLTAPSHIIDKVAPTNADEDGSTDISAGDTLTYTVTATNNGTSVLTNMVVTDDVITPDSVSCTSLAPGATCVLTGTYTVTLADVVAGSIVNTASSDTDQTESLSDTETVAIPNPELSLVKSVPSNADEDGSTDISAGDTLSYTITATNSGAAVLTNVVVNDPLITPDTQTCASLAPGATCVLTGSYSVTSLDVSTGTIDNTATAQSVQTPLVDDSQLVSLSQPSHILDKMAPVNADDDGSTDISAGDTLTYTITATNNGAAILTNMVVSDPGLTPDNTSCASVNPGGTCVLTGTYVVTAADVALGSIVNVASSVTNQTAVVEDTETVNVPQPGLSLVKSLPTNADEDGSTDISAGDTLSYTITATNSGTAVLTNLVVNDPMISPNSITCASVAPGAVCELVGSYSATSDDVTAGVINNVANAAADQHPQVDGSQTVSLNAPSHVLDKSAPANADEDGSTDISAGDTLTYTITATNNGSATLTNMVVSDSMITPNSTTCASVAAGATCVLTGTHVVTAADVVAGTIVNTASSVTDQTPAVDDVETVAVPAPALALVKAMPANGDEDGSGDISTGDTLSYTITATNSGTAVLTNLVVSDPKITPDTITCAVVAPNATCVLTGSYSVTGADVAAGLIENTATAIADQTPQVDDSQTVSLNAPSHALDKAAPANSDEDGSTDISASDTLTYTITATNNGAATLTNMVVTDTMLTPSSTNCASVAPAATCVLIGTYTVDADDVAAGSIVNTASSDTDQTDPVDDTETVIVPAPALSLNKPMPANADEDGSGDVSAGDTLTYTITATNSGTAVLTNLVVSDPITTPATSTCALVSPGNTCVLTGTYTVTTADVVAGTIINTATALSDQTPEVDGSQSVALNTPSHVLDKAAPVNSDEDGSTDISAGDTLTYTITATNNGAATLTNMEVSDPMLTPNTNTCATVASGATCILVGTYTVTSADVAAGSIVNTADSDTDQTNSVDDTETVLLPTPALALNKAAPVNADEDGSGDIGAGDTLSYTVTATNSGTATLTNVVVNDPMISPDTNTCATLTSGATCVLTGTYSVQGTDVIAGIIDNTATADSDQTSPIDDSQSVSLNAPSHVLEKTQPVNADEDGSTDISVGDTLTYTITATNNGAATLTNMVVNDPMLTPDSITCATLAQGADCVLTGSHTVTATDVAAGSIVNTATSDTDQTGPQNDTETVVVPQPEMLLVKSIPANGDQDASGDISEADVLTYTITATNSGTAILTNVTVVDPLITPNTVSCAQLLPGDSCVLVGDYSVTASDVVAGQIDNTATADSVQTTELDDSQTVVLNAPSLVLDKSAPVNADEDQSGDISVGDTLSYTITATNNGSSNLTNVVVTDPMIVPDTATCATVAPGSDCVLTGTYSVVATDVTAGSIDNTATASSDQTPSLNDTESVPVNTPDLALNKPMPANSDEDGSGDVSVGDTLTYTITATNSGTANLTNVVVNDPMIVPSSASCASLAPGAACVLVGTYSVSAADVVATTIDNTATTQSDQTPVIDASQAIALNAPSHILDKTAPLNADEDASTDISVGDTLTYTITATNNGAATLTNMVVNDPMLSPDSIVCASVASGETCVLTGSYVVTTADVTAGNIINTATSVTDQTSLVEDTETVAVPTPALTLVKAMPINTDEDSSGDISEGDTLSYTITATNSGSAVLTDVVVADPLITPATSNCALVTPGQVCELTGTYSVTAADVVAGSIDNTATADSVQTDQINASRSVLLNMPSLSLVKSAPSNADEDTSADISVGDTLTYTITATNNGGSNLTNVVVTDPLITPDSVTCASLPSGDTCVLVGEYSVVASDIALGQIDNTATADSDQTPPVTDSQSVLLNAPSHVLSKAIPVNSDEDGSTDISAGDTLTYTVTATNNGAATLTNLVVSDPMLTPANITCASVATSDTCVLTGTYTVTATDVAAGSIVNTANSASDQTGAVDDTVTVDIPQPVLVISKPAPTNADEDGSLDVSAGDTLSYVVTATNDGTAVLTNVVVSDPVLTPGIHTCALLAPGANCVLNGTYMVATANVTAGVVNNTATAVADQTDPVTDFVSTPVNAPALTLNKSAPVNADEDGTTDISVADTLTYTIVATNNGSSNLTNVVVSDPLLTPDSMTCATLDPTATCELTGSYVVSAADVTATQISNTATADSDQTGPATDVEVTPVPVPTHTLVKSVPVNSDEDNTGDISVGDTLTYTITAANSGSAVLTNLQVTDSMINPDSTNCAMTLPGETCVLVGDYVVTAADVSAEIIENTANAASDQTPSLTADRTLVLNAPALGLTKNAPANADEDGSNDLSIGDTLTYTITATNNGLATLTNVMVTDQLITPDSTLCAALAAGESCVLTGVYTVSANDVTAGQINNTANADSDQTDPVSATNQQPLGTPSLTLTKAAPVNEDEDGSGDVSVGDTLSYTITAANDGGSTLTDVVVSDPILTPDSITCATLIPGDNCVLVGSYVVTVADQAAGLIINTASANSLQTPEQQASVTTDIPPASVGIEKSLASNADEDGSGDISVGDTLTYNVIASNDGVAVLTNVVVTDEMLVPESAVCAAVSPGATCELTGTYSVQPVDVVATTIVNTAMVNTDQLAPLADSHTVNLPTPALALVKAAPMNNDLDGSGNVSIGDELTYTITATNTGDAVLTSVVVSDPMLTPATITCDLLTNAATCVLTGTYTVAANDAVAGEIVNTATADSLQTDPVSDVRTVPVTVLLPPVTQDDSRTNQPLGKPVIVDVLADDSDPENNIDYGTVALIDPATGAAVTALVVPGDGNWSVDPQNGAITFTPEAGFIDDPTPVQYTVTDTTGLISNISTVTIDFEPAVSLTGTVWMDADRDGEIDTTEPVKPNWTLEVYDDQGVLLATTVTDSAGQYAVDGLVPGEFTVKFYNDAGVYIAESTTDGPVAAGASVDLPLPVDPSGIVYDSITREPIPGVTLNFLNSAGVRVDEVCLNTNQQGQTTGADGFYAFDIFPAAHASCPDGETYSIEVTSVPPTYQHAMSAMIPADTQVFDSAADESACTVDSIPTSNACEVQANAGAPQSGQATRYFMAFTLTGGDTNVIFNHIPLDPFIAAAQTALRLQKTVSRSTASVGDVLYYTVTLDNDNDVEITDVVVTDDLPRGFRFIEGSLNAVTTDADNNQTTQSQVVASGIDPVLFSGLTVPAFDAGVTTISYTVRVGAGVMPGEHVNTAQVTEGGTSNLAEAAVRLVSDPVLGQATLIGKVFHDRDNDGYQEDASASGITIKSEWFGKSGKYLGELPGRGSELIPADDHQLIVNIPLSADAGFQLSTAEGTFLDVDVNQQVTESHTGIRAHGMTAQDIRITTQVVNAVPTPSEASASSDVTEVLQVIITNHGVHEQGLPGVRLATVGGLLIETDQAGRFHIPDDGTMNGHQFILKLDTATLPAGAELTTENPRVLRLSDSGLNVMNFGVSLPVVEAAATTAASRRSVQVMLGSVFFDTDKHHIRGDQRGVVEDIITNLKNFKRGEIRIEAHTDSRMPLDYNIALAKRRAKTVENELRRVLGDEIMQNVDVEVDLSAYKEADLTTRVETSQEIAK